MELGELTLPDGRKPDDLDSFDFEDITLRASESSSALMKVADFLEQLHRTNRDDLAALFGEDWQVAADHLHQISEKLEEVRSSPEL